MRILLLATARKFGGAERQLINLGRGLSARGHEILALALFRNACFEDACRATGVRLEVMDVRGVWDLNRIVARYLKSSLRFRPEVVYGFLVTANLMALALRACLPAARVVWGIRSSDLDRIRYDRLTAALNWVQRRCAPIADLVIANSEAGRADVIGQGFPERNVTLVRNGFDTTYFRRSAEGRRRVRSGWQIESGEKLIGLVARLDPLKDHPTFLRAAAQAARQRPTLKFACIGDQADNGYREGLERSAKALNLDGRLIWAGTRRDMPEVYSALDVLTLTSAYGEGAPNSAAEAMACGVPSVVTDVGDCTQIVGDVGVVVPTGDAEALVEGWFRVLDSVEHDRDALRKQIEENFGLERMVDDTERLLAGLRPDRYHRRTSATRRSPANLARGPYQRIRNALSPQLQRRIDSATTTLSRRPMRIRLMAATLRRRLDSKPLFVGWLLSGDEARASTRVRGLLPHAYLRTQGVHSVVLAKRQENLRMRAREAARIAGAGFDVLIFQGVAGEGAEKLARALRASGCRTVYAVGEPERTRMPEVVDRVVLASESLRNRTGAPEKATVIESMLETPSALCKDYSIPGPDARVRVVWVGYPENLHLLAPVREALADPRLDDFELVTISRGPEATFQWNIRRVWDQLVECDIAVLPSAETDWYLAKPNTRMTMLKALGLPIVASPIPSYVATLTDGRGCYFARDVGEWADCLASLSEFERRREMGLAERDEVLARYGPEAIGRQWLELFERLIRGD